MSAQVPPPIIIKTDIKTNLDPQPKDAGKSPKVESPHSRSSISSVDSEEAADVLDFLSTWFKPKDQTSQSTGKK